MDNAIKYTPNGGNIRISVREYELFVRVDIADTGIGMTEEETAKIFTRFYRSPRTAEEPGVGIGLYLCREIISMEGGYIKVSSEPEKGSVFSVFLPSRQQICQNCKISDRFQKESAITIVCARETAHTIFNATGGFYMGILETKDLKNITAAATLE